MAAPRFPHITISKDGEPDRIIVAKSNDDDIAILIGEIKMFQYQYRETHEWLLERVVQINNLQVTYDGTKDNLDMAEYENRQLKTELAEMKDQLDQAGLLGIKD